MNKQKLLRFIDKFYLNGKISQVILNSKDNILSTTFLSGDKLLLGEVSMTDWKFEDAVMGIYNTERLYKLLQVLDSEIEMKQSGIDDKAIYLEFTDKTSKAQFMLADPSILRKPPTTKKLPEFTLQLKLDKAFINKFIAGRGALPDTDTFTVKTEDGGVKIIIGYSAISSNRLGIKTEVVNYEEFDNVVSFDIDFMKEILNANKECENATLEISEQGLARIKFDVDEYSATYYLVAVQEID